MRWGGGKSKQLSSDASYPNSVTGRVAVPLRLSLIITLRSWESLHWWLKPFFHVSLRYDIWSWGLKLYLCQIIKPIKSILTTFNCSTSCFSPHVKWDARSRSVCGAECHGKENCMTMVTCLHCATVLVRAINGLLEVTCHCFVVLCMIHNTLIYSQLQALFYGLWSYIAAYKCNALLLDRFWVAKVGCYWVQNDSVSKNIAWTVELKPWWLPWLQYALHVLLWGTEQNSNTKRSSSSK